MYVFFLHPHLELIDSHVNGCDVILTVLSMCISLMSNKVECVFMCHFFICESALEKSLSIFELYFFYLVWRVLYIL